MLAELKNWLGATRLQVLAALLILTGIASAVLQVTFPEAEWLLAAQTFLVLIFLAGAFAVVSGVLNPQRQRRLAFMILPALGLVALGILIQPLFRFFLGAGLGWLLVSQMMLRDTENREYKLAVKALRKNDYALALAHMNALIVRESDQAEHYGFRAQLYRLNNQPQLAKQDYQSAVDLNPHSAVGANGLAEIFLSENDLIHARQWADRAYQIAPQEWVTAYNLGMIAERQHDDKAALVYLQKALDLKMPDSRHRLLAYVWLIRVYHRQHKTAEAKRQLEALHSEKKGLQEWKIILETPESAFLRQLFQQDVRAAQDLMDGKNLNDVFVAAR